MVLHVLGHGLAAIQTFLDLGMSNITTDNDGTGEAETSLHGILADGGQDFLHGLVQINLDSVVHLGLAVLFEEATGIVFQFLHEETFLGDLGKALGISHYHST